MNGVKNKKGLTMIEVLMAMTIFAVGFLAIGTMVISTTRNNTTGNIITHATMLARERIEFLKSLPIEQMKNQCSDDMDPERLDEIFERVCGVDVSFSSTANIIVVKVSWQRHGKNREVVLKTLTRGNGT
jgi:prepilin-type N-terminal cleavage/methylation domain-containing protein